MLDAALTVVIGTCAVIIGTLLYLHVSQDKRIVDLEARLSKLEK